MAQPFGYWVLVLHTHIPYVLSHGRSPHGTDWLVESASECYLPLWEITRRLQQEGIAARYTLSFTPVLLEQLAHPAFAAELKGYLAQKRVCADQDARAFLRKGERWMAGLAYYWQRFYAHQEAAFESLGCDIIGGFRALQEEEQIEIITSAATHGYLPLIAHDECVRAQIFLGVQIYQKHFGRAPSGFWLPECAYRPGYRWEPPLLKSLIPARERAGVEAFLGEAGVHYFFVDTHMLRGGAPLGTYLERFPALAQLYKQFAQHYRGEQAERSPYHAYRVPAPETLAVFARDPATTVQVWSGEHGYPGDARYLEFHKQHYPGRLRYWRVSENKADLASKQPYVPYQAYEAVQSHAEHFVSLIKGALYDYYRQTGTPGALVSMYDTELFGHWWHEGPEWLYAVIRRIANDPEIEMLTASAYLKRYPPKETLFLPEGSWGEGGYHAIWLNEQTEWVWERLYRAEVRFLNLARQHGKEPALQPYLQQLARELLLLQSSDWTFLITTQSARDYAEARVQDHWRRFEGIATLIEQLSANQAPDPELAALYEESRERDALFEELFLDCLSQGSVSDEKPVEQPSERDISGSCDGDR